jgi:hypothetical protein
VNFIIAEALLSVSAESIIQHHLSKVYLKVNFFLDLSQKCQFIGGMLTQELTGNVQVI